MGIVNFMLSQEKFVIYADVHADINSSSELLYS